MIVLKRFTISIALTWSALVYGVGINSEVNTTLNQTGSTSKIALGGGLPFQVQIEQANFSLPNGIHSGAFATYQGKWLLLAGRTNGLHGFNPTNNFPPEAQNTTVYVVDPIKGKVWSRSLLDPGSGLTRAQIDLLSVTSPQHYQSKDTLYITGGYGIDTTTGQFSTKTSLSAINVSGLMHWVREGTPGETAVQYIRQIFHPEFQVTGGVMTQISNNYTLLIFGQNFVGNYTPTESGQYIEQVRRFSILDDGKYLGVKIKTPKPDERKSYYRRRDLNVVPVIRNKDGKATRSLVAYSGVFTKAGGVWTVPVTISADGKPSMQDPKKTTTFKQGMNNYVCPTLGLFSKNSSDMYTVFFGGLSYGYFVNGVFTTDAEIPFINQVTTIKYDNRGNFSQYLLNSQYPVILSTGSNPGNPLLFGAGAYFIPVSDLPKYNNGVLKLDRLGKDPLLVGYIVGGIESTLPNTNTMSDSAASPYIFRVIIQPFLPETFSEMWPE
jgi:hypothetical protein